MSRPVPTIQALHVHAIRVPMQEPHRTANGAVTESPLVLTDVISSDGVTGHSIVFTYAAAALEPTTSLIRNFEPLLIGQPLAPAEIGHTLAGKFRLLGTQGLVGVALAGIDIAVWDALARRPRPRVVSADPCLPVTG